MIRGAPYWNDRQRYYVQTNNPTEQMLKKVGVHDWLESCGSDAMANCAGALGKDFVLACPGGFQPQIDEVVTGFLNDPRKYADFRRARPGLDPASIPGNRVPQYFPVAARQVFGIEASYFEGPAWNDTVNELLKGHSVQLCLVRPSHYIAAVAYDDGSNEIIFNDSWPDRFADGNGFNRRLPKTEESNLKNFYVVYQVI